MFQLPTQPYKLKKEKHKNIINNELYIDHADFNKNNNVSYKTDHIY